MELWSWAKIYLFQTNTIIFTVHTRGHDHDIMTIEYVYSTPSEISNMKPEN